MALIECKNLTLGYEGKPIVSGLDFKVSEGDYLYIIGENGSGKSTLMKALLGHKCVLGGEIIFDKSLSRKEIGYLPQQTVIQRDFPASVKEIVYSGCLNGCGLKPFYSASQKKHAKEVMAKLGLTELENRCYRELSGGQQQRVLLARALCATKKLLILDEPVAGLDPVVTRNFYQLIEEINKDGITVIMVSHDMNAATEYASHFLHICHTPSFYGTKHDYLCCDVCRVFNAGGEEK